MDRNKQREEDNRTPQNAPIPTSGCPNTPKLRTTPHNKQQSQPPTTHLNLTTTKVKTPPPTNTNPFLRPQNEPNTQVIDEAALVAQHRDIMDGRLLSEFDIVGTEMFVDEDEGEDRVAVWLLGKHKQVSAFLCFLFLFISSFVP